MGSVVFSTGECKPVVQPATMGPSEAEYRPCDREGGRAEFAERSSIPQPNEIIEIANYARSRPGVISLCTGESDRPTPAFIVDAATRSLARGETSCTPPEGSQELREALARYHDELYGAKCSAAEFFVTASGMQALQIAIQAVVRPGDEVIIPTPAWPNSACGLFVAGARPVEAPMRFDNAGWRIALVDLVDAITARTGAIVIASPGNPTGWVADLPTLQAILDIARKRKIWIIADEAYARFVYSGRRAPSFRDVSLPEDPIVYVNTFSKAWAMTRWSVGWIQAGPRFGDTLAGLLQQAASSVPAFVQRAACAALDGGEYYVAGQVDRARKSRDIAISVLAKASRIRVKTPEGGIYLFFSVAGASSAHALAFALIDQAGVAVAPGSAFGAGADNWFRLCFNRDPAELELAVERLTDSLDKIVLR
jgi:aspartate/methionine/tyrosine aminotransferase